MVKQCVLAMKDIRKDSGRGEVYGFVAIGKSWQMLKYDDTSFPQSEEMLVLFSRMGADQNRWMDKNSALVDCMYIRRVIQYKVRRRRMYI